MAQRQGQRIPRRRPPLRTGGAGGTRGKVLVGLASLGLAGGFFYLPWFFSDRQKRLMGGGSLLNKKDGLTPSQALRGVYVNSSSRDIGIDENWQSGRYVDPYAKSKEAIEGPPAYIDEVPRSRSGRKVAESSD